MRTEIDDSPPRRLGVRSFRRRHFGAMDHGAIGDDADVRAFATMRARPKRDREVRAGIGRTVVGFDGKVLVFEKTAPDRRTGSRAQEAAKIERR